MKVAISSAGNDLDSQIDPRFGRCRYFIIVETDDMKFDTFENESAALSGSAGIQSASFVASQGVKAVLTGHCGPKAAQALSSTKIDICDGQTGTVRETVEKYKNGELTPAAGGNVSKKFGMGGAGPMQNTGNQAFGRKMGIGGGGRCMGGSGRGMGMGGGQGMGRINEMQVSNKGSSGNFSREQELRMLKDRAESLKKEMKDIESRINNQE